MNRPLVSFLNGPASAPSARPTGADVRSAGAAGRRGAPHALAALATALVLAGCASPGAIAPKATLAQPQQLGLQAGAPAFAVAADWWRAFGDPTLDGLVEKALADSPDLRLAAARIDRAVAVAAGARADAGPNVVVTGEAVRQRYTENGLYPAPLGGSTRSSGDLELRGSWDLDFFGRHRAELEAALGGQRSAEAERAATRLALANRVVDGYVQLARLVEQQRLAERTLAQRDSLFGLTRERVVAGLDTNVELRQSEGGLPEARTRIEALGEQMTLARHALAVLTAQPPGALDGLTPALRPAGMPLAAPADLPAELLGQRPDVAAARWRVEAASQDVKAARAEFYPNVNLTAFAGLNAIGLGNLLQASSRMYGVGPAISLPIFDAGRLRANLGGRTADLDAAVESYNIAVRDAVREVADQVASAQSIARQQREQSAALAAAESAYDLAVQRYRAGLGTYLVVLTAEGNVIAQRAAAVDLGARALQTQSDLARALGGGWQPPAAGALQVSITADTPVRR